MLRYVRSGIVQDVYYLLSPDKRVERRVSPISVQLGPSISLHDFFVDEIYQQIDSY